MVRREGSEPAEARATEEAEPRCVDPAGESPVRVIAYEPGSRPPPEAERPAGEAWCQRPSAAKAVGGEQQRGPQYYLQRWPSKRSMKRARTRVQELTDKRRGRVKDVKILIDDLNPVLRGWGNYFRTGTAARKFLDLDNYVVERLNSFRWKRYRRHVKAGQQVSWSREEYEAKGLHRLHGTIRYPKQCMLHRETPNESRVREIRTHGLNGGGGNRIA